MKRDNIILLKPGEEEHNPPDAQDDYENAHELKEGTDQPNAATANQRRKKNHYQESINEFLKLDDDIAKDAKTFTMKTYNPKTQEIVPLVWNILSDTEQITKEQDPMKYPETLNVLKDIDFDDEPYENIFFAFLPVYRWSCKANG